MNAVAERFLRSVRTEVLDHVLVLDDRHLERVLREYVKFFADGRSGTTSGAVRRALWFGHGRSPAPARHG